jgi:hypothetical protein
MVRGQSVRPAGLAAQHGSGRRWMEWMAGERMAGDRMVVGE